MKLRLHTDTLRLRLSQPDVAQLAETGRVEESIVFASGRTLTFAIELQDTPEVAASFEGDRIAVVVPRATGQNWIDSDQTGIDNPDASPKILIEKDFQCLHRDGPEPGEAFPNPLMDKF
jgi:hypothetical protein